MQSSRARSVCWCMATAWASFRRRRCSRPRAGLPRSASRWSGISPKASATASTRKACAMAASFSSAPSRAWDEDKGATQKALRAPAPMPAHVAAHAALLHLAELAEDPPDEAPQLVVEPHRQTDRLGALETCKRE